MKNSAFSELTDSGKRLFRKIKRQWSIADEPGLSILLSLCQCNDEMAEHRAVLRAEGSTVTDRWGQTKIHPRSQLLKESRAHFLQCAKALNLDLESLEEK